MWSVLQLSGSDLWPHMHAEVVQGWEKGIGSSEAGQAGKQRESMALPHVTM